MAESMMMERLSARAGPDTSHLPSTVKAEMARQKEYNEEYTKYYYWVATAFLTILVVRNIFLFTFRRLRPGTIVSTTAYPAPRDPFFPNGDTEARREASNGERAFRDRKASEESQLTLAAPSSFPGYGKKRDPFYSATDEADDKLQQEALLLSQESFVETVDAALKEKGETLDYVVSNQSHSNLGLSSDAVGSNRTMYWASRLMDSQSQSSLNWWQQYPPSLSEKTYQPSHPDSDYKDYKDEKHNESEEIEERHLLSRPGSPVKSSSPRSMFYRPSLLPTSLVTMETFLTKSFRRYTWFFGWTWIQILVIVGVVSLTVTLLMVNVLPPHYPDQVSTNRLKFVSYRSAVLATANMVFAFVLAGRNNILTMLTGVPYEKLRYFHKAIGTIAFLFGAAHGGTFLAQSIKFGGWEHTKESLKEDTVYTGLLTLSGFATLFLFSLFPIRKYCYEFFLVTHFFGYVSVLVGLWMHQEDYRSLVITSIAVVAFERVSRFTRKFWNAGFTGPYLKGKADVISGAIILRVRYPGSWNAGAHAYCMFYDSEFLSRPWLFGQNHPWSIANVPGNLSSSSGAEQAGMNTMIFIMKIKSGMTKELERVIRRKTHARLNANLTLSMEGPYGQETNTGLYSTVMLFAGGSGVTHTLSMFLRLIQHARANMLGHTHQVYFTWMVQDAAHINWVTDILEEAFQDPVPDLLLNFQVFVTRGTGIEVEMDSKVASMLKIARGRPDIQKIMQTGVSTSRGSVLAVACGPKGLTTSVQNTASGLSMPSAVWRGRRNRHIDVECPTFG